MLQMTAFSVDTGRQSTSPLISGVVHRLAFYLLLLSFTSQTLSANSDVLMTSLVRRC